MVSLSRGPGLCVVNITNWRGILDFTLELGWVLCRGEMRKGMPRRWENFTFIPSVRRLQELRRVCFITGLLLFCLGGLWGALRGSLCV